MLSESGISDKELRRHESRLQKEPGYRAYFEEKRARVHQFVDIYMLDYTKNGVARSGLAEDQGMEYICLNGKPVDYPATDSSILYSPFTRSYPSHASHVIITDVPGMNWVKIERWAFPSPEIPIPSPIIHYVNLDSTDAKFKVELAYPRVATRPKRKTNLSINPPSV
jgi:hypothetical protein